MRKLRYIFYFMVLAIVGNAHSPIIQTVFTDDPASLVYNDTLFLYTSHNEDEAAERGFIVKDYLCFSTTDMVNWTHHGSLFHVDSLEWIAPLNANAAEVAYRNGKNALCAVKMNKDMLSYSGEIITFDIKDQEAFGADFEEAPWMFKRDGIYYMLYAAHIPEAISICGGSNRFKKQKKLNSNLCV